MDIRKCYTEQTEREWDRLEKDAFHKLEFDTTIYYLKRYLPKKGLILDAGGGPGRYSIALAKMGYDVVLLDYTSSLLKKAKEEIKKAKVGHKIKGVFEGSITNLSMFKDNQFDAVICLGAVLGHIKDKNNREIALKELKRITKKNKHIFVSVISKFGVLMHAPKYWPEEIKMTKHLKEIIEKGEDNNWHGKYYAHMFTPKELEKMFKKNKIKIIKISALEGISTSKKDEVSKLANDKKFWKNWMWAHYRTLEEPTIVSASEHFIIIGKK